MSPVLTPQPVMAESERLSLSPRDNQETRLTQEGKCARCSKGVFGEGRACRAMGELFHDTCFTCSTCGKQLSGKCFYLVSGRIYCDDDYLYSEVHPSAEMCHSCGYPVTDTVLQAHGKSYHPACFCCVVCKENLEGQAFTVGSDSRVYCVLDYHRVKGVQCAACKKPILPSEGSTESIRVVSYSRNYHVECFGSEVNLT